MILRMSNMKEKTLKAYGRSFNLESQALLFRAKYFKEIAPGRYMEMPGGRRLMARMEAYAERFLENAGCRETGALPCGDTAVEAEAFMAAAVEGELNSYKDFPAGFHCRWTRSRESHKAAGGLLSGRCAPGIAFWSLDASEQNNEARYKETLAGLAAHLAGIGLETEVVRTLETHLEEDSSRILWARHPGGEDKVLKCSACGYKATDRMAGKALPEKREEPEQVLSFLYTPEVRTIKELSEFTRTPESKLAKALVVSAAGRLYGLIMPGDRELNLHKLARLLSVPVGEIRMAEEEKIEREIGSKAGFIGPMGLRNITLIADSEIPLSGHMITGSNKRNYHVEHVLYGRDYQADRTADIVYARPGDPCPVCGSPLEQEKGVSLGFFRNRGTGFSKAAGMTFLDAQGKTAHFSAFSGFVDLYALAVMACESNLDADGVCWPDQVAPYDVQVLVLNAKKEVQLELGGQVAAALAGKGLSVLLDDRRERAGFKFKDSELLGVPKVVVVGNNAAEGLVEYRDRRAGTRRDLPVEGLAGIFELP